jgi:hypothetical protein
MTGSDSSSSPQPDNESGTTSADGLNPSGGDSAADNIRDEQGTHAGGAVPPAFVGSAEPEGNNAPEEALEHPEKWDSQG